MTVWFNIAARNLLKNRRRSLFTVLAIGFGFAAVNIFGGFTHYVFQGLKDAHIYAQADGHLMVFKEGFLSEDRLAPQHRLLTAEEVEQIEAIARQMPQVILVAPQLYLSGLVSNGETSTVFLGGGRIPSQTREIRNHARGLIRRVRFYDGQPLEDDVTYGVGLSRGLMNMLGLNFGATGIVMTPTVDGQVNALDFEVRQVVDVPEQYLDKVVLTTLPFAQSLYDTTGVDRLTILLDNDAATATTRQHLQSALSEAGLDVVVRTWVEMAPFYTRVKDMFDVIFVFIFIIVFIIVVMSVINTIGMAVLERTREIGTLRALGLKRFGVIRLFAIESALLGVLGSALGVFLTLLGWLIVRILEPTWIPPQISRRVPLEVHFVPRYMLISFACLIVLSLLAAVAPARRAARLGIVDALGHS